ncbi:MAG: pilus assembly PilX N-terminal domain-containing protein [Thermoanaerobaculia bacterium]
MKRLNKGSALLVTLLIMVILTLTGISFLFMADTENKISNNYYLAMQSLVAAQSGIYMVNSWFNHANDTMTLLPPASAIQFLPRTYTSDSDSTPEEDDITYYKWACNSPNSNCTNYKLFDRPFVGTNGTSTVYHRFFGTSEHPDLVISYSNSSSVSYLDSLNTLLLGTATGPVRISEIKLYSPPVSPNPLVPTDPNNTPYGICTAEITAETVRRDSSGKVVEVLSTRRVKGVITDINFAIAGVALDVDGTINMNGSVRVWWGTMKTTEHIQDNNVQHLSLGAPWYSNPKGVVLPCGPLFGTNYTGNISQPLQGKTLEDPWFLLRSRKTFALQPSSKQSLTIGSCPSSALATQAPGQELLPKPIDDPSQNLSCDYVFDENLSPPNQNRLVKYAYMDCQECNGNSDSPVCGIPSSWCNASVPTFNNTKFYNVFGCDPTVGFANAFRGYNYWKNVITTIVKQGGGKNIYYLVPGGASAVGGVCPAGKWGPPKDATKCYDFETWTSGKEGFWFFDTNDGKVPRVDGANITAEVSVKGSYWSGGVQYICAQLYESSGGSNNDFTNCKFPGEPLWENMDPHYLEYRNGNYDAVDANGNFIDRFINLRYPEDLNYKSLSYVVDADAESSTLGTSKGWDKYGPTFTFRGYYRGILYLTGKFWARGDRDFYGSVMIWNADDRSNGNVQIWYNPQLKEGITQDLPTAYVEQILTDM